MKRLLKYYSYIDNVGNYHNIAIYKNMVSGDYSIYVDGAFYSTAENRTEAEEARADAEMIYKFKPQVYKF